MLLQSYSIEGFMSIKNSVEVDLKKTQYQILEKTNVENGVLKGCMFVGANASGKTNLIWSLNFLLNILFSGREIDWERYLCLFSDRRMFENTYNFLIEGKQITYLIRYQSDEKLLVEKLIVDSKLLMERIGSSATSELTERREFSGIPSDSVFLRDLWFNTKFRGHEVLQKWFDFMRNSKCVNPLLRFISAYQSKDELSIEQYVKANGVDELNAFLRECGFDYLLSYHPELKQDDFELSGLYVKRENIESEIPMSIESLGNKILLMILPAYLSVIKHGGMLICDEFSSGLHNDLEELLIKYFMKHARQSQIFIVSHSTNLLSSSLFRPDQLYAVNFDRNGTNIVRFSSEQPRTGQNYEKMYLGGVFSGLPQYSEI